MLRNFYSFVIMIKRLKLWINVILYGIMSILKIYRYIKKDPFRIRFILRFKNIIQISEEEILFAKSIMKNKSTIMLMNLQCSFAGEE